MIKSKLTLLAIIPFFQITGILFLIGYLFYSFVSRGTKNDGFAMLFFNAIPTLLLILFLLILLIFRKITIIKMSVDYIEVQPWLKVHPARKFELSFFDGFFIGVPGFQNNFHESLYLVKNSKCVVIISQDFHDNYHDLKKALIQFGVKSLGNDPYPLGELKRLFEL